MGYTIGDVLTVIGFIFGTLFAIWALMVCFALLFPVKAEKARRETQEHPWRAFWTGLVFNGVLIFLGTVLTAQPLPIGKLFGYGVYVLLLGTMAMGGSGISLLSADRIQQMDRRRSGYRALERGALLLVAGALLPVFGWFGFAPIIFTLAGGAGFRALFVRRKAAYTAPAAQTTSAAPGEFVV